MSKKGLVMYKTASYHHSRGHQLMNVLFEDGEMDKIAGGIDRILSSIEKLNARIAQGGPNVGKLKSMRRKLYDVVKRSEGKSYAREQAGRIHFDITGPGAGKRAYSKSSMQGQNFASAQEFKGNREDILRTLMNDTHSVQTPRGSYTLDGKGSMVYHDTKGNLATVGQGTNYQGVPALPADRKNMTRIMREIDQAGGKEFSYKPLKGVASSNKKYYP